MFTLVTKLYELFRGNLCWHYSLTKYPLLHSYTLTPGNLVISAPFHAFENPVNRTYRLDSPPIMQGLSASCIYIRSGDPVRVLRLSHNKYAGYTLKHLLLRHMYNLPLPKLHATLLVAGAQLSSAVVTL